MQPSLILLVALCALSPTAASADEDHQDIRVKVVNVSGGLTEGAVRDGLDPVIEHMEACYLDRRKEIPRLRGTLLIDVKVDAEGAVVALKSREDSAEDEGLLQCFDGLSETLLAKPDRALASSIRLEVRLAPPPFERIQRKAQDGENVGALIGVVREPDSVWAYDPPDLTLYGRLESSDVEKAVGKLKKRIAKAYRGSPTEERVEAGEKAMLLIRFVVPRGGGRVDRVRAAGNDGVDEALEAEFLALFGKLKLPAPKGGGIAQVTYPLVFE